MRLFKSFALLAAALAINGCSVGPRYSAPQTLLATYHSTDPRLINDTPLSILAGGNSSKTPSSIP